MPSGFSPTGQNCLRAKLLRGIEAADKYGGGAGFHAILQTAFQRMLLPSVIAQLQALAQQIFDTT